MKNNTIMAAGVAALFIIVMMIGVQKISAQINFDDPGDRYWWVKDAKGNKILSSLEIFPQAPWTPEIEKTLTYKSAKSWGFGRHQAWNSQRNTAALTVLSETANVGCDKDGNCYLYGCYRETEHNRLLVTVNVVTNNILTERTVVEKQPVINVDVDTTAIAQAVAQANVAIDVCPNIPYLQAVYPANVIVDIATGNCVEKQTVVEVDSSWCETSRTSAVFWGAGAGAGAGAAVGNSKKSRGIGAGVGAGVGALIGALSENRCYAMIGGGAAGAGTAYWTRKKGRKTDNGGTGGWHPGGGSGGSGCTGRGCL